MSERECSATEDVERRLKYIAEVNPSVPRLAADMDVSFVPMEAIGEWGGIDGSATRTVASVRQGYTPFRDGDVVFAKITPCFENGKGGIARGLTNGFGYGTTELHVLRATRKSDARWLLYLTQSHLFRKLGESEMYGAGGQKRVPPSFVANFRAPAPPLSLQRAIADFLDRKTAAIDALIEKKQRLIELLQEKRQALITQAVTKGLDPNVPMKDSGIEWLGQIPTHWGTKRLKHFVARAVDCPHSTPEYDDDGPAFVVRTADLDWGVLRVEQMRRCANETYVERSSRMQLRQSDLLYSREGERFGMAALVPSGARICLGQRMMAFRCASQSDPSFLMWALNSRAAYSQVVQDTVGATSPRVNIPTVLNLVLASPSFEEQRKIGRALNEAVALSDEALVRIGASIDRLREYRQALITAAVTGKLPIPAEPAA